MVMNGMVLTAPRMQEACGSIYREETVSTTQPLRGLEMHAYGVHYGSMRT